MNVEEGLLTANEQLSKCATCDTQLSSEDIENDSQECESCYGSIMLPKKWLAVAAKWAKENNDNKIEITVIVK